MSHILAPAEAQAHAERALGRLFTAEEGERFRESIKAAARAAEARRKTLIIEPPLIGEGDQGRTAEDTERDLGVMVRLILVAIGIAVIISGLWLIGWLP